jgi:hypothetical protein
MLMAGQHAILDSLSMPWRNLCRKHRKDLVDTDFYLMVYIPLYKKSLDVINGFARLALRGWPEMTKVVTVPMHHRISAVTY